VPLLWLETAMSGLRQLPRRGMAHAARRGHLRTLGVVSLSLEDLALLRSGVDLLLRTLPHMPDDNAGSRAEVLASLRRTRVALERSGRLAR